MSQWVFSTTSKHSELNGHTASNEVRHRDNFSIKGFLASAGNRYAMVEEDFDDLAGYIYSVYINQQDYEQSR